VAKAKKKVTKKVPAKKAVTKKAVAKKTTVKKVAARKAPKKKLVAKKTVAKKTGKPVKKVAVKKPVAKKPVAKKSTVQKTQPKVQPKTQPKGPYGLPEQLRDAALKVLDERQAEDIVSVNMAGRSAMADYMIIASGRASKQLGAIAHYLREEFEKLGATQMRVEGMSEGNWVLMDAGDIIVHLFRPEVRRYYNLEQIWDRSGRNTELSARDAEDSQTEAD